MTTFIIAKLNKSDDETIIDKYRVSENIKKISYYIKNYLPKNHHSKMHDDKTLFHVKNVCKKLTCLKWTYGLYDHYMLLRFLHFIQLYPNISKIYIIIQSPKFLCITKKRDWLQEKFGGRKEFLSKEEF